MSQDAQPEPNQDLTDRIRAAGISCPGCGFDLSELAGPVCPECGRRVSEADLPRDDSWGAVLRRLGPAAVLGGLWTVLPAIGGFVLLANMAPVSDWLRSHQQAGYAIYIVIFILSAGLGLLPTYSQAILAGYAFGAVWGFPAALAGFVGAALVGRVISQRYARERVEREIATHKKARVVRDALVGRGFWPTLGIVTLVRVPPNSPFALTNLVLSSAGVRLLTYVVGTAVGMAPRTAAAVVIGEQVTDWSEAGRPRWMIIAGIAVTVVVILIIGQIASRALQKLGGASEPVAPPPDAPPE